MFQVNSGSNALVIAVGLSAAITGVGLSVPIPKDRDATTPFVSWSIAEDFKLNDPHDPLVVGENVVVGTDRGQLRAYRCSDGKLVWSHEHGKRIYHRPSSDGTRIYFASADGLTAVLASDGTKAWIFNLPFAEVPTLVLDKKGMVYVGGGDGNLYAVDAKTGKEKWKSDFITDAPPAPPNFPGPQARLNNVARPSALASDGETIFLSVFDQSRIVAVNATSGKRLWSFQTGGWIHGAAAATEKHVFVGSQDGDFYCLEKQTGKQLWKRRTLGRIESGGVLDEKFAYFGSCDGALYCVNQADGKERWRFATDPDENGRKSAIYSVPVLRWSTVCFCAGEGQMYGLDRDTGTLKWKIRPSEGSEQFCSAATDGKLFFVTTRARHKGPGAPSLIAIGLK
jgi:outer membrane protein assembly factor BamB